MINSAGAEEKNSNTNNSTFQPEAYNISQLAVLDRAIKSNITYKRVLTVPVSILQRKITFLLCIQLMRNMSFCPNISFQILLRNVIPVSSDIIIACRGSELNRVQEILSRRKASPNDMTEDGRPLLWVCCI
jgi:hypothetical protein